MCPAAKTTKSPKNSVTPPLDLKQASLPKTDGIVEGLAFDPIKAIYGLSRDDLLKQNVDFLVRGWTAKVSQIGFNSDNLRMHGDLKISGLAEKPNKLKSDAGKSSVGVFVIFDSLGLFATDPKNTKIIAQARKNFEHGPLQGMYVDTHKDFAEFLRKK